MFVQGSISNEWHLFRVLSWLLFLKCRKSSISTPAATSEGLSRCSPPSPHVVLLYLAILVLRTVELCL